MKCFAGINSTPGDHCPRAWIDVCVYILFNLLYNLCTLLVLKYGSATLVFVASSIRLPLVNIAFTWTWLMGPEYVQKLNNYDIIGLAVIIVGLICYRFGYIPCLAKKRKKGTPEEEHSLSWGFMNPSDKDISLIGVGGFDGGVVFIGRSKRVLLKPKNAEALRKEYFNRLGITTLNTSITQSGILINHV